MRAIEWTGTTIDDMAVLDPSIARRIRQTIEMQQ